MGLFLVDLLPIKDGSIDSRVATTEDNDSAPINSLRLNELKYL